MAAQAKSQSASGMSDWSDVSARLQTSINPAELSKLNPLFSHPSPLVTPAAFLWRAQHYPIPAVSEGADEAVASATQLAAHSDIGHIPSRNEKGSGIPASYRAYPNVILPYGDFSRDQIEEADDRSLKHYELIKLKEAIRVVANKNLELKLINTDLGNQLSIASSEKKKLLAENHSMKDFLHDCLGDRRSYSSIADENNSLRASAQESKERAEQEYERLTQVVSNKERELMASQILAWETQTRLKKVEDELHSTSFRSFVFEKRAQFLDRAASWLQSRVGVLENRAPSGLNWHETEIQNLHEEIAISKARARTAEEKLRSAERRGIAAADEIAKLQFTIAKLQQEARLDKLCQELHETEVSCSGGLA